MGKSAPEWGNQPRSPTPRCSSLPPGPSRRRRFLGHRGYARNADASSQIESSCPGPATSPRTLPAGTAKPTLVWGRKEKASRGGEAESPQHLCCPGGASAALPVPNQRPGSATRLACPLCAGLDGSRDTQHVHPRDPRLLHPHPWHGRGPQAAHQAPPDTKPRTGRTGGDPKPCSLWPNLTHASVSLLAALGVPSPCTGSSWGGDNPGSPQFSMPRWGWVPRGPRHGRGAALWGDSGRA